MDPLDPNAQNEDGLIANEAADGSLTISETVGAPQPSSFDFHANLAPLLEDETLTSKGQELKDLYTKDAKDREPWLKRYQDGVSKLRKQAADNQKAATGSTSDIDEVLSKVDTPMIVEAAVQFSSKAIVELFPDDGPVSVKISGGADQPAVEQAERVKAFMNWQIVEDMPQYRTQLDQMMLKLAFCGHQFKKVYFDAVENKPMSVVVDAEDFIVAFNSKDLESSSRYTHRLKISRNDFNKNVEAGVYTALPEGTDATSMADNADDPFAINDADNPKSDDPTEPSEMITLLEMHVYGNFTAEEQAKIAYVPPPPPPQPVIEGQPALPPAQGLPLEEGVAQQAEADASPTKKNNLVKLPYVITLEETSGKIVSIRRNWKENDPLQKKRVWFVDYKFVPGMDFYGYGFYHLIGDLQAAATGALRALMDSAAYSNIQGGFKLKGGVAGGDVTVSPGTYTDIEASVDDIHKAIMPLPFKEPSQTLFALMEWCVASSTRFASITDMDVGSINNQAPVGTTLALIEQGSKNFNAIHKRLHYAQKQEFLLVAELNAEHLDDQMIFTWDSQTRIIYREDFNSDVSIIPVSNPDIFTSQQRIALAQASLDLASEYPEFHNKFEAVKRMHLALKTPNLDELLVAPEEAEPMDPVSENAALLTGKPIGIAMDQDHKSHVVVHKQFLSDPQLLGHPAAAELVPIMLSHIAEHMAALYKITMMQRLAQMGLQIPQDGNIPPEMDNMIAQGAAQIAQEESEILPEIPGLKDDMPPDPQALAAAMTEADIRNSQAKAQADMDITAANAELKMQIIVEEHDLKQRLKLSDSELEQFMDLAEHNKDMQALMKKNGIEIDFLTKKAKITLAAQLAAAKAAAKGKGNAS